MYTFYLFLWTSAFARSFSPQHLHLLQTRAFYLSNVLFGYFDTLFRVQHPSQLLLTFFPFLCMKLFVACRMFTALCKRSGWVTDSSQEHKLTTNFIITPVAPRPSTQTIQTTTSSAMHWNIVPWHRVALTMYATNVYISSMIWSL